MLGILCLLHIAIAIIMFVAGKPLLLNDMLSFAFAAAIGAGIYAELENKE